MGQEEIEILKEEIKRAEEEGLSGVIYRNYKAEKTESGWVIIDTSTGKVVYSEGSTSSSATTSSPTASRSSSTSPTSSTSRYVKQGDIDEEQLKKAIKEQFGFEPEGFSYKAGYIIAYDTKTKQRVLIPYSEEGIQKVLAEQDHPPTGWKTYVTAWKPEIVRKYNELAERINKNLRESAELLAKDQARRAFKEKYGVEPAGVEVEWEGDKVIATAYGPAEPKTPTPVDIGKEINGRLADIYRQIAGATALEVWLTRYRKTEFFQGTAFAGPKGKIPTAAEIFGRKKGTVLTAPTPELYLESIKYELEEFKPTGILSPGSYAARYATVKEIERLQEAGIPAAKILTELPAIYEEKEKWGTLLDIGVSIGVGGAVGGAKSALSWGAATATPIATENFLKKCEFSRKHPKLTEAISIASGVAVGYGIEKWAVTAGAKHLEAVVKDLEKTTQRAIESITTKEFPEPGRFWDAYPVVSPEVRVALKPSAGEVFTFTKRQAEVTLMLEPKMFKELRRMKSLGMIKDVPRPVIKFDVAVEGAAHARRVARFVADVSKTARDLPSSPLDRLMLKKMPNIEKTLTRVESSLWDIETVGKVTAESPPIFEREFARWIKGKAETLKISAEGSEDLRVKSVSKAVAFFETAEEGDLEAKRFLGAVSEYKLFGDLAGFGKAIKVPAGEGKTAEFIDETVIRNAQITGDFLTKIRELNVGHGKASVWVGKEGILVETELKIPKRLPKKITERKVWENYAELKIESVLKRLEDAFKEVKPTEGAKEGGEGLLSSDEMFKSYTEFLKASKGEAVAIAKRARVTVESAPIEAAIFPKVEFNVKMPMPKVKARPTPILFRIPFRMPKLFKKESRIIAGRSFLAKISKTFEGILPKIKPISTSRHMPKVRTVSRTVERTGPEEVTRTINRVIEKVSPKLEPNVSTPLPTPPHPPIRFTFRIPIPRQGKKPMPKIFGFKPPKVRVSKEKKKLKEIQLTKFSGLPDLLSLTLSKLLYGKATPLTPRYAKHVTLFGTPTLELLGVRSKSKPRKKRRRRRR